MYVLVKYQDGVKKIVPSSDIKNFDPSKPNYAKKYKIKWTNGDYYEGIVIIVGDTEKEVRDKDDKKRHKITPFALCESADEMSDTSIMEKTDDKNNNIVTAQLKEILKKKIAKAQTKLDEFVTVSQGQNETKEVNAGISSSTANAVKKKISQPKIQAKIKSNVKINKGATIRNSNDSFVKEKITSIDKLASKTATKLVGKDKSSSATTIQGTETIGNGVKFIKRKEPLISKTKVDSTKGGMTQLTDRDFKQSAEKPENAVSKLVKNLHKQGSKIEDHRHKDNKTATRSEDKISSSTPILKKQFSPESVIVQRSKDRQKTVGCDICKIMINKMDEAAKQMKNMEVKVKDATSDVKKIQGVNNLLKQTLKDKEEMLQEATRLNLDLQGKVLDEFDELKVIVADLKQRAQENLQKHQGVLPIGYKRLDKSMIHLGQDVWITIAQYDSISSLSETAAKFVKNMAIAVYGTPILTSSSVTGSVSNRLKNKDKNAVARPKLDPTKLLAIKDALGFWLKTEKKLDEVSIDIETSRVGTHISHKIFELLRKEKKRESEMLHVLPNVNMSEEDVESEQSHSLKNISDDEFTESNHDSENYKEKPGDGDMQNTEGENESEDDGDTFCEGNDHGKDEVDTSGQQNDDDKDEVDTSGQQNDDDKDEVDTSGQQNDDDKEEVDTSGQQNDDDKEEVDTSG